MLSGPGGSETSVLVVPVERRVFGVAITASPEAIRSGESSTITATLLDGDVSLHATQYYLYLRDNDSGQIACRTKDMNYAGITWCGSTVNAGWGSNTARARSYSAFVANDDQTDVASAEQDVVVSIARREFNVSITASPTAIKSGESSGITARLLDEDVALQATGYYLYLRDDHSGEVVCRTQAMNYQGVTACSDTYNAGWANNAGHARKFSAYIASDDQSDVASPIEQVTVTVARREFRVSITASPEEINGGEWSQISAKLLDTDVALQLTG